MNAQSPAGLGPRDLMVAAMMNVMWGLNIVAVKMSVELFDPFTAAFLRQAVVALVCLPALMIVPGRMRILIPLGLLSGGLFYVAVNLSLAVSDNVSALAIAGQLGVPFSVILAIIFLGERIRWIRATGIALALGGVSLLVFDPSAGKEIPGLALTAIASLIWAICSLFLRQLAGVPVRTIYAWVGCLGSAVLLPIALIFEPGGLVKAAAMPIAAFGWIAFSAIGSTVLGQGAMSWLLQRHPVTAVLPLTLAAPVISVIAASLWFKIPFTLLMGVGGAIALVGVAIVSLRTAAKGGYGQ